MPLLKYKDPDGNWVELGTVGPQGPAGPEGPPGPPGDGGSTVFQTPTQPVALGVGDIWIDTSGAF